MTLEELRQRDDGPNRIVDLCDIAMQDALVEVVIDGDKIWLFDGDKFLASLAGNGYKVIKI